MKKINLDDLPRKEQFNYFNGHVYYSITTKIDITNVYNFAKNHNISIYYSLGYTIYSAMKEIPEYCIRYHNGELVTDCANVLSFCSLDKGETVMKFVGVEYCDDIVKFCQSASEINKTQKTLCSKNNYQPYEFAAFITCLPWLQISSFTNPTPETQFDFIPRLAWDKFEINDDKVTTNLNVEVNHKLIDGYLLSELIKKINEKIANLK